MRPFSINIRGRVKNFNLPKNQPLVPLFEAIELNINKVCWHIPIFIRITQGNTLVCYK